MDPLRDGADHRVVYRNVPSPRRGTRPTGSAATTTSPRRTTTTTRRPARKRGLGEVLKRLLNLHLHEFHEIGRATRRRRSATATSAPRPCSRASAAASAKRRGDHEVRTLSSYPWLVRLFPKVVSYDEEGDGRKFVFAGWRPQHRPRARARSLETGFKFRLEDMSHFATHGRPRCSTSSSTSTWGRASTLTRSSTSPSADPSFPFKFNTLGNTNNDNYAVFVTALQRIFNQTESVDAFRDPLLSRRVKLGFERFGPACATPEFQEVELRLWTLVSYCRDASPSSSSRRCRTSWMGRRSATC